MFLFIERSHLQQLLRSKLLEPAWEVHRHIYESRAWPARKENSLPRSTGSSSFQRSLAVVSRDQALARICLWGRGSITWCGRVRCSIHDVLFLPQDDDRGRRRPTDDGDDRRRALTSSTSAAPCTYPPTSSAVVLRRVVWFNGVRRPLSSVVACVAYSSDIALHML